jgi:hypothetical protein
MNHPSIESARSELPGLGAPSSEPATRPRARFLKRVAVGLAAALAGAIFLILGLYLFQDPLLKFMAESRFSAETGLETHIGRLHVAVSRGIVSIRDLTIRNPPEFGGDLLLDMPELHLELDPEEASAGRLRFKTIRVHLEQMNVVCNREGKLNIEPLTRPGKKRSHKRDSGRNRAPDLQFEGIETLRLTVNLIHYIDMKHPSRNRDIRVGLKDEVITGLKTEEDVKQRLGSLLLGILLQEVLTK